jgi:glycosyltransferase involved in cell wall biosynthesis
VDLPLLHGLAGATAKMASRWPLRSPRVGTRGLDVARRAVAAFAPHVAVVSEVHAAGLAAALLPDVPWVYDAHNVESELYAAMRRAAASPLDRVTFAVDERRVAATERRLLTRADRVVAVSEGDADGLRHLVPGARIAVVPSSVPTPTWVVEPAANGPVVLFIGSLDYPPNTEAVDLLVGAVLPAVRAEVPDARLVVAGRRPPARMRARLAALGWATLQEDLPDLDPLYAAARCTVLPIRSGSGSRLKVYEALAHGLPVIATPEAIAGVSVSPGHDAAVAAHPADLARACVRILTDDAEAARLGEAGRETFVQRLSWDVVGERLADVLGDLV